MYLCICVSVYLCICVSVYLCICVSVYLCICVSVYLCICASVHLCICVSVYLCICVSVYLCICLYVCLCICVLHYQLVEAVCEGPCRGCFLVVNFLDLIFIILPLLELLLRVSQLRPGARKTQKTKTNTKTAC